MIKKIVMILVTSCAFSFYCLGDTTNKDKELKDFLIFTYFKELKDLENKMISCQNTITSIEPNDFKGTLTNWEDISIALEYFYNNSQYECTKIELKRVVLTAAKLAALDTLDKKILDSQNYIIMNGPLALHKSKIEYLTLPLDTREKLEQLDKLKNPFDILITMENFGL